MITILDRQLHYKAKNDRVIWFDFRELCEASRSQLDYIALADLYETFMISHIPQLDNGHMIENHFLNIKRNRTQRFISLIDELYDRNKRLLAAFECELKDLYLGKALKFEFERTSSRLYEMMKKK